MQLLQPWDREDLERLGMTDLQPYLRLQALNAQVEQEVELGHEQEQQADMGVLGDVGQVSRKREG